MLNCEKKMTDIARDNWAEKDDLNAENVPYGFPPGLPANVEKVGQMMMGAVKRSWRRSNPFYQTTGSADNYVVTPSSPTNTINIYEVIRVRIDRANTTTTPTLQFSNAASRAIKKIVAAGKASVEVGDMIAGHDHEFWYDGTDFVLCNPYQQSLPVGTTSGTVAAGDDSRIVVASSALVRTASEVGGSSDSAVFSAIIAAYRNATAAAGRSFSIKDIALSNSQSIEGNNTIFSAASGATDMFILSDYDARINNLRVSDASNASEAIVRVKKSRTARVDKITAVNVGAANVIRLAPDNASVDVIALPFINGMQAEQVSGIGAYVGQNVSEIHGGDIHFQGTLVTGAGGGLKPIAGSVGWRQSQTLSGSIARGGHQMSKMNMIAFEKGWWFTDIELLSYTDIIGDSCSDFGLTVDGTGNNAGIKFNNLYVGTSRGARFAGNADVEVNGLETLYNGSVFSWMASDFYAGTCYDIVLEDTAKLTISGYWRGDKKLSIASTAKLVIACGAKFIGRSGAIGASQTGYLCEFGSTPTEGDAIWRAPYKGRVVGISAYCTAAPGAGQTFTYTLRKNFAATAFNATIAGASAFGGDNWYSGGIPFDVGESGSLQLMTSAGAATSRHQTIVHFVPD